ncbi:TOTE conflict system archaeo-eukaryotic primase domain-containing protein [Eggerthella sinensis]|uniref:TOTE conflict system archaeo-eukaryotic primase domain-containing protein n=1 Tax=Eggerthella sinensis TaxID=242230 RepID=UPI00266BEE67|nr:DEAD/DEAH box helicase family protein [Eggerthella sinensis]
MSEPSDKPSRYALIHDREATFAERIVHGGTDKPVIVYTDPTGARFYASEDEWLEGSRRFAKQASLQGIVTADSSTQDKLALFRKLFKGRSNVYAHGYRKKDGGIGYAPACKNEWESGVCPKKANPRSRCADCPNRAFAPVSDAALIAHFQGKRLDLKDVVGLYVLDKEGKTCVLVADFDKTGWEKEIAAYRRACEESGIDVAVERSRSGNGGHAWIFFSEPIEAGLARNLGCTIITSAMAATDSLGFNAYDRLYPAQTTVAEGGFGSLIALPFQGMAKRQDNSVFVDERFEAYPDQWRFLSTIEQLSPDCLRLIVDRAHDGPLGPLALSDDADNREKPWQPRAKTPLGRDDFPSSVSITKANMLFVEKEGLSPAAVNRIRRLAAFGNPEFYRAQAMRQSVFNKPRVIDLSEETDRFIALPRGCEDKLTALLDKCGAKYRIRDARHAGTPIDVEFEGSLRPLQQTAAEALLRHECGVLSAPTGFGKTVVGAYCIARLNMRTLVIVPGTALLDQWQQRLESFLVINEELPELRTKTGRKSRKKRSLVGQIGGGKNIPSGIVDIATFQSLFEKDDSGIGQRVKDLVRSYDLVICDECQHGAAPQLERILRTVNARRVYGLSATPKRADGLEIALFMQCGPIRYEIDPKTQAAEQSFARRLQPRFTYIRLANVEANSSFNQILDQLCTHDSRNRLIVDDAANALEQGRTPLVITKRKEHAARLANMLEAEGRTVFTLTGEGTAQEKKSRAQAVRDMPNGERFAIVATGSYLGEGFDEPRLDTLMLAAPASWEGVITQYSGRLHREHEGKSEVIVYDYIDTSVPMLERMYKKRLRTYKKLGYELAAPESRNEPTGRIVDASDYRPLFAHDLESASKSIFVSSPYLNTQRLNHLTPLFEAAVSRGIAVSITTGEPANERSARQLDEEAGALKAVGCTVIIRKERASALAIIDERIVWYGAIPLLAFPKSDDCTLRFESCEVAYDLLQTRMPPA